MPVQNALIRRDTVLPDVEVSLSISLDGPDTTAKIACPTLILPVSVMLFGSRNYNPRTVGRSHMNR